jgi:type II secretory pathway component GspD/PulD (secretin)
MDMRAARASLFALLVPVAGAVCAQQTFEVIPLRHSTLDQVLPALRPLLEPGGTLSGHSGQLIVRASPRNVEELRRALESIDRPRRRLQISVRFDDSDAATRRSIEADGRISSRGSELELRAQDARGASQQKVEQRVQVLEGGRAVILAGESRPIRVRERIQTPGGIVAQDSFGARETASGFEVVPRLVGGRVQLEIAPQRERFADARGAVQTQRVATTTSAALGEWVQIGGAVSQAMGEGGGIASASRSQAVQSRQVWVRVDEVQ